MNRCILAAATAASSADTKAHTNLSSVFCIDSPMAFRAMAVKSKISVLITHRAVSSPSKPAKLGTADHIDHKN